LKEFKNRDEIIKNLINKIDNKKFTIISPNSTETTSSDKFYYHPGIFSFLVFTTLSKHINAENIPQLHDKLNSLLNSTSTRFN
jgi:hypothetical protein